MLSANAFNLDQSKNSSFGKELEWVKLPSYVYILGSNLSHSIPGFWSPWEKPLENIMKIRESTGIQHFLPFPSTFSTVSNSKA